mmetsp:Transcript_121425/g.344031  ORF Transcript_121425/g.344031 Transcript_121425/m.344031 type:complete len:233 (-) Transcript_121425:243-941(-)
MHRAGLLQGRLHRVDGRVRPAIQLLHLRRRARPRARGPGRDAELQHDVAPGRRERAPAAAVLGVPLGLGRRDLGDHVRRHQEGAHGVGALLGARDRDVGLLGGDARRHHLQQGAAGDLQGLPRRRGHRHVAARGPLGADGEAPHQVERRGRLQQLQTAPEPGLCRRGEDPEPRAERLRGEGRPGVWDAIHEHRHPAAERPAPHLRHPVPAEILHGVRHEHQPGGLRGREARG